MTVRVGMIGAGAVAARHARTLSGFDDVLLTGVADPDGARARALAAELGARAYGDHEALLEAGGLDAVYVCVPPFAHGPPERAAIDAGLPFFVEKPLSLALEGPEAIARRVAERGLVTAAGYHWRYLDTVRAARELVDGRPARLVLAYWLDKVPPPGWWLRRDRSGGQTVEQTTHVLDLLRFLAGEVSEVHAATSTTARAAFPGADVADVSAATLRLASGAVGSVFSTCLLAAKLRAGVELFYEGLALELSETELVVQDGAQRRVTPAREDAKTRADRTFIDGVKGSPEGIAVPYAEALRTHRLACAIADAAQAGAPVRLEGG